MSTPDTARSAPGAASEHRARKRFGQHFLVDRQVISDIVERIAPQRSDLLVEIGPGLGALSEPLLRRVDHLQVVELDRDIVARLQNSHFAERLRVHAGDALAFDFGALARQAGGRLRIVGNLPYNISTPLLFHLAGFRDSIRDMHFMLQKEVVERMVAIPGNRHFGRLSVMLQYRFEIEQLLEVPPAAFSPPPKVYSAVVRLLPRPPGERAAKDEARFAALVASAFAQRRKMLRNSLRGVITDARLDELGVAPTCRAEDLSVDAYLRLANSL